ncbi:MAG: hypothetical protein J7605_13930 [Variovorax sp.]|nr:hypothetical protein [Variovorax sp.]
MNERGDETHADALAAVGSASNASASAQASEVSRLAAEEAARAAAAAPAAPGTSTTSLTVGEGTRTLITDPGRLWAPGQFVHIALASDPAGVGMNAVVGRYDAATGAMDLVVGEGMAQGSGTFADWVITGSGWPTTLRQLGLPVPGGPGDGAALANHAIALDATGEACALRSVDALLGFTPVRQGVGPGQGLEPVSIGWSATLMRLLVSVEGDAFGDAWPIDVSGRAAVATNAGNATRSATSGRADSSASADYAASASNAYMVNGIGGWTYNNLNYNPPYLWATAGDGQFQFLVQPGNLNVSYANSANYSNSAGRASNADNADRFMGRQGEYWLNNGDTATRNIRNNGVLQLLCGLAGYGDIWCRRTHRMSA